MHRLMSSTSVVVTSESMRFYPCCTLKFSHAVGGGGGCKRGGGVHTKFYPVFRKGRKKFKTCDFPI